VKLFCDECENTTEFDKVRTIARYDAVSGTFLNVQVNINSKNPPPEPDTYIICRDCGNLNVSEIEEEEDEK